MNKIPVGKTIAHAYSFTLSELGSIIGLAWICLVAIAVLQFLPYMAGGDPMAASANPMQAGQHAIQGLGLFVLSLLLAAVIDVAVTRLALGTRPTGAIAHFALGAPEFRVFGAIVLVGVVLAGMAMAGLIGVGICIGVLTALHNQIATGLIAFVAILAFVCALTYLIARLTFVLVPATVVEEHISLSRGWILTQGNFWRIFAIMLATALPLMIVGAVATAFILGPDFFALFSKGLGDPQVLASQLGAIFAAHAPMLIGLRLVLAPFEFGLTLGAAAFGYRALAAPGTAQPSL